MSAAISTARSACSISNPTSPPARPTIRRGETHSVRLDCRDERIEVFLDGDRVHVQDAAGFSKGTVGFRAGTPAEQGLFQRVKLSPL